MLSYQGTRCALVRARPDEDEAQPRWRSALALASPGAGYLSRRDMRRSASGLAPVWQVGQYCSEESAKETSRIVSPHTGQGWPVLPCTRRPVFFSPLRSAAASPPERSTASRNVVTIASCRVATSS